MLLVLWSIKVFLFTNLIFMSLTIRNPEIVFLHADNCGYICFSLLGQILRYFTGLCTGCWYFVNDWRRHGLYWRKRSEHIRRTESSSCFGEVIASSISTVASSQILWFLLGFLSKYSLEICAVNRAIYHGSDIFMLDDVLSAVDAQVAQWILYNAILGPLMKQCTRVLCTHNVQVIPLKFIWLSRIIYMSLDFIKLIF